MRRLTICLLIATCSLAGTASAKDPIPTPADTPVVGEMDAFLLGRFYNEDNADAKLADIVDDPQYRALIAQHKLDLFGGPMLGSVTPTSARIWVRTARPAAVKVVASEKPDLSDPVESQTAETNAAGDLVGKLQLDGLKPWTVYHYDVLVDGRSMRDARPYQFKTFPTREQKVAFGIGFGGGARYVPEKERMWDTIADHRLAAFLFLGDNIYIDEPDWRNKQRVMYYRRQLRPEYRRLVAGSAMYAIWDDHDFGANDCSGGPDPFTPAWKVPAWKVFRENWVNPAYGGGEERPGCWFEFSIGDVDFFMTDGRYYRDFKNGKTMLGPHQKRWLLERLAASQATFKVICSGTLWTEHADKGGRDSWWGVPEEREEIFSLIDRNSIGGVILLSADRHRTDIFKIERPNGYPLYEFETSKLTNNHTHGTKQQSLFSYNQGNFFCTLEFDRSVDDPTITFQCISIDDEVLHTMTLKRSQLQKPPSQ